MTRKPITCASITASREDQSFVFHEKLGAFHSDWHQHEKGQLMYAENGFIHVNINEKKLLLPSWYCAWVPAHTLHEIWSNSPDLYIRTIYFEIDNCKHPIFQQPVVFSVSNLLKEMIWYTEKWHSTAGNHADEKDFLKVLQQILPGEMAKSVNVCLPSTTNEKLLQVLEYLQAHLKERTSIISVSKQFGFSVRTLTRLFSTHLGISFSSYTKIARIIKALELIENGNDNVSQIAYEVGYESLSTFSNNFLEICGNRPLYFINKKRGEEISNKPITLSRQLNGL